MIQDYSAEKKRLINTLEEMGKIIESVEQRFDFYLGDLKTKVNTTIEDLDEERFAMAFFGAFSDGKSTILSALTKNLSIPISPEPTTDEVRPYPYKDFLVIDTPGLFSDQEMHSELTNNYISEANIVIFTIDPTNPLKATHHPTVRWLLKDLGKARSIVWVINKMDEVADLDDEDNFQYHAKIKSGEVVKTLQQIAPGTEAPYIVCIAGDPDNRGLDYWLANLEEYRRLSRIDSLILVLDEFVQNARAELVLEAGFSVIRDGVFQVMEAILQTEQGLSDSSEILRGQLSESKSELNIIARDRDRAYKSIRKDVRSLREEILLSLQAVKTMADFKALVISSYGKDGYILEESIDEIIREHVEGLLISQEQMVEKLHSSMECYQEFNLDSLRLVADLVGKGGGNLAQQSTKVLADNILKFRDAANLPVKFKPYGARHLAQRFIVFGKFLAALPVILDGISVSVQIYDEYKLNKQKEELHTEIEQIFSEFFAGFTLEVFQDDYFGKATIVEDSINELSGVLRNNRKIQQELGEVKIELNKLLRQDELNQ